MTREFRVLGPPGTGKTTYTAKSVDIAAEKYGSDAIVLASFTKTAAAELAGRGLPISPQQVGTLHAHAFRALRAGDVKLVKAAHIKEWNAEHPLWTTTAPAGDIDEPAVDAPPEAAEAAVRTGGKVDYLAEIGMRRNRLEPESLWPTKLRDIGKAWRAWKDDAGLIDFTDLLEICLRDVDTAPGAPAVGFLDEAQDSTPLQLALWRKWGARMDTCVLVGDDDQCLYDWAGASPDGLLEPQIPPENTRVLAQSYRVPKRVHAAALSIITRVSRRAPKDYHPTGQEGRLERSGASFKAPGRMVTEIRELIRQGKTCMVLGACGYMLKPLIQALREAGIPYHNPYRRHHGDWNPMAAGSAKKTTVTDRLRAWFRSSPEFSTQGRAEEWTWEDVQLWAEHLESKGAIQVGGKAEIKRRDPHSRVEPWDLADVMVDEAIAPIYEHNIEWFLTKILASKHASYITPCRVAATWGKRAIIEPPKGGHPESGVPWVVVGTIHSVKGGEADHVWIFPDLSTQGSRQWESGTPTERDSIRRLFYVALTRAREAVHVCEPAGRTQYQLWRACQ